MKKLGVFLLAFIFIGAPSICLAIPISYHWTHHNDSWRNSHTFDFRGNNGAFIANFGLNPGNRELVVNHPETGWGLAASTEPLHSYNFRGSNPEMDWRQAPPLAANPPFSAAENSGPLQISLQSENAAISETNGNGITPVPEPATLLLLGAGLLGLVGFRRMRK